MTISSILRHLSPFYSFFPTTNCSFQGPTSKTEWVPTSHSHLNVLSLGFDAALFTEPALVIVPDDLSHWTSFSMTPIFPTFLRNNWPSWFLPPSWKKVVPWFWGHHTLSLLYSSRYSSVSFMGPFSMLGHILPAVYAIAIPSCFLWMKHQRYSGQQGAQIKILPFLNSKLGVGMCHRSGQWRSWFSKSF